MTRQTSPYILPGFRELAPGWSSKGSHSYLYGEVQVQACQNKSEPNRLGEKHTVVNKYNECIE